MYPPLPFLALEYYGSTLTKKVFYTVCDLIKAPFIETDYQRTEYTEDTKRKRDKEVGYVIYSDVESDSE